MATIYVITLTTHYFNTNDFEVKNQYTHNVGAYSTKESAVDYLKYKAEVNEYKLNAHPQNRIERSLNSLRIKTYEMVEEQEVVYVSEYDIRELELQ
jgi:hypothetical protein